MISIAPCPNLTQPDNGKINCSLGDDGFRDTCSFTCNTGYDVIGSFTRICQINGTWNGIETNCSRGI